MLPYWALQQAKTFGRVANPLHDEMLFLEASDDWCPGRESNPDSRQSQTLTIQNKEMQMK